MKSWKAEMKRFCPQIKTFISVFQSSGSFRLPEAIRHYKHLATWRKILHLLSASLHAFKTKHTHFHKAARMEKPEASVAPGSLSLCGFWTAALRHPLLDPVAAQ